MESINSIQKKSYHLSCAARSLLVFTLYTAISSGMAVQANAQTFAEWFRQNSTQKKYLLQQIEALQVFSTCLKKGYQIAHTGLSSISGSLNSENKLHNTYYSRLNAASPEVKNNDQVKDILVWQKDILTLLDAIDRIDGLTNEEKQYLANVSAAVFKDCDSQLSTLQRIITSGKTKMSDAERLALIEKIHSEMLDNYRFATGFSAQAKAYGRQRLQEHYDALTARQVYGIN